MTRRRDVRPRLFANALGHPDLSNAERVFLMVAIHLPAEYVDGERRPGSLGMTERGKFALHYDYLARALHTTPASAKKAAQRLESKGWLSKVHPGTYGRPAMWHLLDVRGDKVSMITAFRTPGHGVPPYGQSTPLTRGDMVSPLTYRTPDLPDHEAASGDSRTAGREVEGSNEEQEPPEASADLLACERHGWADCQDRECMQARESRSA